MPHLNDARGGTWGRRLFAGVLSLTVAWTPWAVVWGDDFLTAAHAGQATGTATATAMVVPETLGNSVQFPTRAGGPIAIESLFPGSSADASGPFSASFGDHAGTVAAGQNAQSALLSDPSSAGRAYRTLRDGVDRPHLDITSQAAWQPTDALASAIGTITKTFADCTLNAQFTDSTREVHVPDYRVCERVPPAPPAMTCGATTPGQWVYPCPPDDGTGNPPPAACQPYQVGVTDLNPLNGVWAIQPPECHQALQQIDDPFCRITVECVSQAVGGGCLGTTIHATCGDYNKGPMSCWTDPRGQTHCPTNLGGHDSCAPFESDPACVFMSSQCVDGATSPNGTCHVTEETWDCGMPQQIPVVNRRSTVACAGPVVLPTETAPATGVRCIGSECASFPSEQSTDFAQAATALQAAQMSAADMQCVAGGQCDVFPGEARECKRAVGGIVNCCKTPGTASLGDYLELVFTMSRINNAIMGLDSSNAVRGAWETLRGPIADAYSAVTEQFTSAANTLMGQTTETVSDSALKTALNQATQELMIKAAEWTANIFGEAAANTLFVSATGGPAVTGGVVSNAGVALAPMLASLISVVMWAYLIYQVVMILIKIIWECEQSEFELGAKRDLKSCVFVGGYCYSEKLGYCIEKRDAYCCFGSPLGRILQEQLRPQLGRGWGSPKAPDCRGLSVADLQQVDWNTVNLDEWMAMLVQTGHFPNLNTLGIDQLTGSGSDLATKAGRPNAQSRTVERVNGLDTDHARNTAEQQLWETTQRLPK